MHSRVRRIGTATALALAATTLGPVIATAPAQAAPGCVDETVPPVVPNPIPGLPPLVADDGCDDSTPPDTTLTSSLVPNGAGLVAGSTMTFAFASPPPVDGDRDPVGFECRLTGPAQPHDWRQCTSPVTYAGLADAPPASYAFAVRAVDLGDSGRNPDAPPPGNFQSTPDTPDLDPTPATVQWGQDTKVPFVFVTFDAYDEETPTQPVVTSRDVPIRLNSSERGVRYECRDDARAVACEGGRWTLADASSGRHVFLARAVDAAGNVSAWSDPVEFFVPHDLARRKGWRTVHHRGWLDGDAVTTRRPGARLVLPRTTVGELRLYASTGPRAGKVRVRVGRRAWHVVNLRGRTATMAAILVLDRYSGIRKGRVVIEKLGSRPVVLDAVVARPNMFPPAV